MNEYQQFIASKAIATPRSGLEVVPPINASLFPFQRATVEWALQQGRASIYGDCGLGKTPMQLAWASIVAAETKGRVLILAPLAVAQQTIREGVKFGVEVVYARNEEEAPARGVIVTNYERLDGFNPSLWQGVVLDESSILKAFMGSTKRRILSAFLGLRWKLSLSATPAPNDHLELGNQAEFLELMSSHEMIARWFINDTSTFGTYRLKGHAVEAFWQWVASWARCFAKPSDLGEYSDEGYVLPPLTIERHVVEVDVTEGRGNQLFRDSVMSATTLHSEKRRTLARRVEAVAELVKGKEAPWVVWCDTDYEADALAAAIPEAVEVRGSQSLERKEKALAGFANGEYRVIVTKGRIAGYGLNWQHCADVAYVGANYSYESFYQTVRRCWRFGQKSPVHAHVAIAPTEAGIWNVLEDKQRAHEAMKVEMFKAMRGIQRASERKALYEARRIGRLPSWLKGDVS